MVLSRKVLLLNSSYEPLSLVTATKAVTLIWRRVAESLELDAGYVLRSPRYVFEVPSVVRLTQYIDVRARQNRVTNRHRIMREEFAIRPMNRIRIHLWHLPQQPTVVRSIPRLVESIFQIHLVNALIPSATLGITGIS